MKLKQLKNILGRTEVIKLFEMDMVCSVPLPMKREENIDYCCFWCRYYKELNAFSTPVVRLSYNAERGEEITFATCEERHFFSVASDEIITAKRNLNERLDDYPRFEKLYDLASPLFYKDNCSDDEKRLLSDFYKSFKDYVDESMIVFYRELVPLFFYWLGKQIEIN